MAVMRRTIIGVPLYRRSRPQGVSGAGPVEKQVITRLESHRTASHLHRHPAQKIFIGTQNGKFLESFPSGHTIATHTHTHIYKKITIIHTYSYLKELFIYHTHLEKVKTRIRIQSHLNSFIMILDKPNQV